jgi:hypothetical protein
MDNPATVSIDDQIACVERELRYREHVYPRRIADKKMTQQLADREMIRMQAVLQTLQLLKITGPS